MEFVFLAFEGSEVSVSMPNKPSFITKFLEFRFFSHKFKFARKKKDKAERSERDSAPAEQRKPLKLSERQRPGSLPEDPYGLDLSVEHPVQQLWRLRRDETGWLPAPQLRLEAPDAEEQPFTPKEAAVEITGVQTFLASAATARLGKAAPKSEDAPPVNLDAQVVVYVAKLPLSAWVMAFPPVGEGKELSSKDVSAALASAKVTYGIDEAFVEDLPNREDRYFRMYLVAQGLKPVPGKNGEVEDLYPRTSERQLPVDEYDRVDYTAVGNTQNIEKDTVICNIIPPTQGVPGRNVLGKELPTTNGVPAVAPMGRNTLMSQDGSQLLAGKTGSLEFHGNKFRINPVIQISGNVDYSTGSVNFLGDVHITGDVCSGFTVRAMGSIKVDGVVGACTIEAGGDLVLAKGVQGNSQAVMRAHGDIFAKYLENCNVYARNDLHSECIVGCQVYCDGSVYIKTGRGAIIGGKTWAARMVEANVLGSRGEVRTTLTLGGVPCEDVERSMLAAEIEEMENELAELDRQPENPAKASRTSKLRMKLSVDRLKLKQYDKSLEAKREASEKGLGPRLIFDVAHPGTRIKMQEDLLRIRTETHHCTAMLVDGKVRLMT